MKILGTGLTGLVGSRIVELLSQEFQFENISHSEGINITNNSQIQQKISSSNASIVLHMAAKTNVDACEEDETSNELGEAWFVNVVGTDNVVKACEKSEKKIIFISTDFVFDGKRKPPFAYSEEDKPHPINWYGETKYRGEEIVKSSSVPYLILRIASPYRAHLDKKKDFARAIFTQLQKGLIVEAVTDQIITPTFVDDIAFALRKLIEKDVTGIYHVVGSQYITPYEGAIHIAETFKLNKELIGKTTRAQYFKNKAPRPFNLALKNDKILGLGIQMKNFKEGLQEIKKQMAQLHSL